MHGHRQCLVILTTFYHMCHLLYSATGDVVIVVYNVHNLEIVEKMQAGNGKQLIILDWP